MWPGATMTLDLLDRKGKYSNGFWWLPCPPVYGAGGCCVHRFMVLVLCSPVYAGRYIYINTCVIGRLQSLAAACMAKGRRHMAGDCLPLSVESSVHPTELLQLIQ